MPSARTGLIREGGDMGALLEIEDLAVSFGRTGAVRGTSLTVERGETLCVVGRSGCGKSVTALAVMNLLARGARRPHSMRFQGEDLLGALGCRHGAAARQRHGDDLRGR